MLSPALRESTPPSFQAPPGTPLSKKLRFANDKPEHHPTLAPNTLCKKNKPISNRLRLKPYQKLALQNDKPDITNIGQTRFAKNNRTPRSRLRLNAIIKKLRFTKRQTGTSPNIGSKHALQKNKPISKP
ncbi:MAG: hypothetical protein H6629_22870 [Calditrichae bacterium]|nr:hypothetical protein [Calditrichia bacterium]